MLDVGHGGGGEVAAPAQEVVQGLVARAVVLGEQVEHAVEEQQPVGGRGVGAAELRPREQLVELAGGAQVVGEAEFPDQAQRVAVPGREDVHAVVLGPAVDHPGAGHAAEFGRGFEQPDGEAEPAQGPGRRHTGEAAAHHGDVLALPRARVGARRHAAPPSTAARCAAMASTG